MVDKVTYSQRVIYTTLAVQTGFNLLLPLGSGGGWCPYWSVSIEVKHEDVFIGQFLLRESMKMSLLVSFY